MADGTGISYCDATVSPVRGCTPASPGCLHCFARGTCHRFGWGVTKKTASGVEWTGEVKLVPEALEQPLSWTQKPRIILWPTMGDLFHEAVPNEYIAACFGVMASTPQHTHLVLTKRIERARGWLRDFAKGAMNPTNHAVYHAGEHVGQLPAKRPFPGGMPYHPDWPLPNVVIGTTVEDQRRADERRPKLAEVAAMGWRTFLSVEPQLEYIDLGFYRCPACGRQHGDGLVCNHAPLPEWVAVGAETGPGARACETGWICSVVEQCRWAGVRCHVKQLSRGEPWNPDDWPRELVEMRGAN